MRLRTRLVALVVGLAAVGLGVAGVAGNLVLHRLAMERVDGQLRAFGGRGAQRFRAVDPAVVDPAAAAVALRCDRLPFTLPGSLFELYQADGTQVCAPSATVELGGGPRLAAADLATPPKAPFTTSARSGDHEYRVLVQPGPQDTIAVLAIDLADVQATWRRQALATAGLGITVVAVLAVTAIWLVRRELRPLEEVTDAVDGLVVSDLSRRVDVRSVGTEVGRLASAFNTMVGRIDDAFTEQRAVEERLRRFAADASHELRTPLSSIRGFAELHRRYPADSEAQALAWRRVDEESRRMTALVEDLLTLARHDQHASAGRDAVELGEVVRSVVAGLSVTAPGRELRVAVDDDIVLVGDESQLRRVVVNLVANALAHTPPATPVEVTLHNGAVAVELRVVDHGPGIERAERARVFERFVRLDESRTRASGGSGLGLAIVRSLVDAHGGQVRVEETPGGGATFVVTLPAVVDAADALSAPVPERVG